MNDAETMSFAVPEMSLFTVYTQEELESMTVKEIKEIADERGYLVTKTLKADIIEEFLSHQIEG